VAAAIAVVALVFALLVLPTLLETLAQHVARAPGSVSYELADAPPGPTPEARVALWLRAHRADLSASEHRFGVDRRAIAAAIAYEAIDDPRSSSLGLAARFSGPGKVHYREYRLSEGNPAAKEVEDLGYLPKLDAFARRDALSHASIAIAYIGAIMAAFVRESAQPARVSCNIPLLTTLYTSWKPSDFAGRPLDALENNEAGRWAARHVPYLTSSAGSPPSTLCRLPRSSRRDGNRK
jgi:hypothetical protein